MGGVGWGSGEGKYCTPLANFKTLVNQNAIKPEIGGPPRDFGKNFRYPLPWIFNPLKLDLCLKIVILLATIVESANLK